MSRDWDILEDVRDRLKATGEFDGVHLSGLPEERGTGAGEGNAAVVQPVEWEEVDEWDDSADVESPRRLRYKLTLLVRREDAETRDRELDRLYGVAADALDGESLAGLSLPKLTRLTRGKYETPSPPERRLTITGTAVILIEGFEGHDTSE